MNRTIVSAVAFMGLCVGAPTASAQRQVEGPTITSASLPAARIALDSSLTYVGTQTVMLPGGTQAEQHFFVEARGSRIVRLYWLQFEGKPEGHGRPYTYSSDPTIEFDGQQLRTNFRNYPTSGFAGPRGSDGDQAQQFLTREGYMLVADLMRVRLVWLLDEPAWNELMIIYLEDLGDHNLTVDDLRRDPERWKDVAAGLEARALAGMRITPVP
jgi:hypothetical protein